MFFVSPADEAFEFETETESEADSEFDEYDSGEEFGESEMVTVQGRGHTGWSVAVSMIAPFAVITLSDYSIFDDGLACEPAIERYGPVSRAFSKKRELRCFLNGMAQTGSRAPE